MLFDRARALYREEGRSTRVSQVFLKHAKLYREEQDLEKAAAWLREAPQLRPGPARRGRGRVPGGQQEFLKHGVLYSVALVSLDLALLLSRQGRTGELKQLAAELMTVFSAQEVHREATAALVLFQRACEEDRGTAELIARLATLRRKG